jgi:hypothetical protein
MEEMMRTIAKCSTATLALVFLAGCAEAPPDPTATSLAPSGEMSPLTVSGIEVERPEVDVTEWEDARTIVPIHLITPEAASDIGTGSAIVMTIPDEGRFGCTANFVWEARGRRYLGAAGHCFLPADRSATHGEAADYDASGVVVEVCVQDCEGNFRTNLLLGTWVRLGQVAYARQTDPTGEEQVGHDFGVVEIPREVRDLVRPAMPVWGGPTGFDTLESGETACHYGHGLGVGELFPTKARSGIGGGSDSISWMGDFAGSFGDSGSGLVACESDGLGLHGQGAIGVLTHLGIQVCPCEVNIEDQTFTAEQGVIFGTTVERAVEMATEANLKLELVLP